MDTSLKPYKLFVIISCLFISTACLAKTPVFFQENVIKNIRQNLLNNIAVQKGQFSRAHYPKKAKERSAIPGAVVAAPYSKENPGNKSAKSSYMYTWVRDSSTVMTAVYNLFKDAVSKDQKDDINIYGRLMLNYISFQNHLIKQKSYSPGIARAFLNGKPDLQWMNPQDDGPGLNSELLAKFAQTLLNSKAGITIDNKVYGKAFVKKNLFSKKNNGIINRNLDYIVKNYKENSIGLWESCSTQHFFTKTAQLKGLIYGAALASEMGNSSLASVYINTARNIIPLIKKHWQTYNYAGKTYKCYCEGIGITKDTVFPMSPAKNKKNFGRYRGMGLDSSILLGVLYGNLYSASLPNSWVYKVLKKDRNLFPVFESIIKTAKADFFVTSPKVKKTVQLLTEAFIKDGMDPFRINNKTQPGLVYLGRYPGDIYNGDTWNKPKNKANAWYLCTSALAQYYYTLAAELKKPEYIQKGNSVMQLVYKYIGNKKRSGENKAPLFTMSEQLNRNTGAEESFRNLSWSYAEYLFAYEAYLEAVR